MEVYIDSDYKCHTQNDGTMRGFDIEYFDGKCSMFINGYRYIPYNEHWTREDGVVFTGEMYFPWGNYSLLEEAQKAYEEAKEKYQEDISDMQNALGILGVE